MWNATQETLNGVEKKLKDVARELVYNWDRRQGKTELQEATVCAFGTIHDIGAENVEEIVNLLKKVILCLPPRQSELFEAELCYPGFLDWNDFWQNSYTRENVKDLDALTNVHVYYGNWVKKVGSDHLEFQKLWESVMVRSTSEAQCETIGSIMNQHCGKNRHLEPEYFSMELVLRVNLGPLNHLGGLINEVFNSDQEKSYLRSEWRVSQLPSNDIHKSSAVSTFQDNNEKKSRFPTSFWHDNWSEKSLEETQDMTAMIKP